MVYVLLIPSISICFHFSSFAATTAIPDSTCPDSGVLSAGIIDKVCWSCVFPIVIFGAPVGGGDRPDAKNTNAVCSCQVGSTSVSMPGFSSGIRAPSNIIEVVRDPHCSPFAGGIKFLQPSLLKSPTQKTETKKSELKTFLNTNTWKFPLLYVLEALLDKNCTGSSMAIAPIGYSSLSPTWNNDELAVHLQPESIIYSNPAMLVFGMIDAGLVNASPDTYGNSVVRDSQFWTIGSWSASLYPFTGNVPHSSSPPQNAALTAARGLALDHRMGQARLTMGSSNMCGGNIFPMLPKTQYKFQHIFPNAQANAPCCVQLGESSFKWNEWRSVPGSEDYLFLVFRWTDCCITTGL